ncbi:MAG: cupin domain-containing protein [candidate division WOR-3 bacterium]|nr:cupin domain-containing protein [candidate division WOR-3 bacterium]
MKINKINEIERLHLKADDLKDVTKQVLIGADDGSDNIIMRLFTVRPGGYTPYHQHDFEHVVKIERGEGIAIDKYGEHSVKEGMVLFVKPGEIHQFKNQSDSEFAFICIIPADNN